MNETILDKDSLNTKISSNVTTVIDFENNDFTFEPNQVLYKISINQNSNTSAQIEENNYSDTEQTKESHYVSALEQLLYSLLKEGNTNEAKTILEKFNDYSSPLIDKWKASFSKSSPPKNVTASLKKDEIEKESKLIKRYKNNYISQWIALAEDKIIASNNSLSELKKEIKSLHLGADITFLKL